MSQDREERSGALVSIALPVYNGESYVAEAVESVLSQTHPHFELLICDNASTDRTEEICRRFAAQDTRIQYIRRDENCGSSGNFNDGFHRSTGKYFKWHAHDDLLEPTYLEKLVDVLEKDPGCVMAYPRTVLIDAEGQETQCYLDEIASDSEDPAERLAVWLRPRDGLCNPMFGLLRRSAAARTGLIPTYISGDRVFLAHLTLIGRCRLVNEALFLRRVHPRMSTLAHEERQALQQYIRGRRRLVPIMEKWRIGIGHLGAIHRTPMSLLVRMRCYGVMLRWALDRRKYLLAEIAFPLYLNGRLTWLGRELQNFLSAASQNRETR